MEFIVTREHKGRKASKSKNRRVDNKLKRNEYSVLNYKNSVFCLCDKVTSAFVVYFLTCRLVAGENSGQNHASFIVFRGFVTCFRNKRLSIRKILEVIEKILLWDGIFIYLYGIAT